MLSSSNHLDVTTTRPRPKPPGSRRASNPSRDSNSNDVDAAAHPSLPQSPPRASSSAFQPSSSSSPGPSSRPLTAMPARQRSNGLGLDQQIDLDLDLDLPSHLTAAIQRSAARGVDNTERMDAALSPGDAALTPSPEAVAALWERARSPGLSHRDPIITSTMRTPDDDAVRGDGAAEVDADGASSGALDKEWVGGLAREELEALLFHANSVIRDRERDLGIAAAIGQALLQKNISLRGRHEKVMNDLDSSIAYEEGDGDDDDTAENLSPSTNEWEDATPLASEANGYFGGDAGGIASPLKPHPRPPYTPSTSAKSRPPLSQVIFNQGPNTAGLIHSPSTHSLADSSVSGTSTRYRAARASTPYSMQTSETQKQLSLLSAQNENLLSQLTELQDEAEDAKREGGKKLRKLNKEIESLQLELEAATQRNTELEQESISASNDERARFSPDKAKKSWAFSQPASPSLSRRSTSLSNSISISGGIEALLSKAGGHEFDDQQRALVVRLLDKMKELESTNKVLEGEKKERESRLGAALEKGVRISDEYDAVLHAHESSLSLRDHMSASGSNGVLGGGGGSGVESQQSSAANSPQRYQKRAIGNRVQVEGRKTVRRALRSHAGGIGEEDEAMTPSTTLSSLASSSSSLSSLMVGRNKAPRRKRSALALNRPRILITPSMEDLAAKRREQAEGWEDETTAAPAVGEHATSQASPRQSDASPIRRTRENSLDPSDANKIAWQMRRSSIDDDQHASTPHTPSRQRRVSPPSLSSPVASTSNGNEGAYDRYMAHFSTPDKTRRAQLEANAAADRSDASPWQRRPSGRYRRCSITSNLDEGATYRQQTLGSELGSVFGDERGGGDDTLRVNETPASQRARPGRLLRSAASFESLGGHSEAMSDIAHLRWSKENMAGSGAHDARGSNGVNTSPLSERQRQRLHQLGQLVRHRDVSSTSNRSLHPSGSSLWETSLSGPPLISPGSLRNRAQEPGEEQYTLLGEMSRDQPVQWADDDDYGVPLKESEARRLGLAPPLGQQRRALPAPDSGGGGVRRMLRGRTSSAALGLLSWAIGGNSRSQRSRSQTVDGSQPTATAAIQSASQLEEERRREEMLRNKYHVARQRRLDQRGRDSIDEEEEYLDEEWEVQERSRALASASAYTSPSRRKAWYNRPRPAPGGKGKGSPPSAARGVRYDQPGDELDDHSPPSPTLPPSSSALALRNGGGGGQMDRTAKPTTRKRDLVRNFKPSEAVDEVTAWISLVFVLILAFFVSASQGPKRILGGEERRAGGPGGEEAQVRKQRAWEREREQEKRRYIQYRDEVDEAEEEVGEEEEDERRSARSAPGVGAVRRGGAGQRGSRSQDAQSMASL